MELAGADLRRIHLAVNPEFMREGSALKDFLTPPFTLVGCADPDAASLLRLLYAGVDAPVVETSIRVAEMLKFVSNAYHALKISFTNEIAALCGTLAVDADEVMRIFRMDRKLNLSGAYLHPGFAFGGSCLPKDVRALAYAARSADVGAPLLSSILPSNEQHLSRGVAAVLATGRRKVGVVGLAFKAGSDDVRESALVGLVEQLQERCDVRVFDRGVTAGELVGANHAYLQQHLPDLDSICCRDVAELCAHAEVLVLGHAGADADEAVSLVGPDCLIIDLCGKSGGRRAASRAETGERRSLVAALARGAGVLVVLLMLALSGRAWAEPPALPRVAVELPSDSPDQNGRVQKLAASADLQEALRRAQPGDTLVLPAGATINKNGAAAYKAVTAVFLCHIYGLDLGASQLFTIWLASNAAAADDSSPWPWVLPWASVRLLAEPPPSRASPMMKFSARSFGRPACQVMRGIAGRRRNVGSLTHAFPLRNQDRQRESNQRAAERPLVTFNWSARQTHVHLSGLHFGQAFTLNLLHRARSVFQM